MSNNKIAIVGAGWYGCHLASELVDRGYEITLFDSGTDYLQGAGANNQLRLHQGFHYLRSYETRMESSSGFEKFKLKYPDFSSEIRDNLYAIPSKKSILDFKTVLQIASSSNLDFEEMDVSEFSWLRGIDGLLKTSERLIEVGAAKAYYKKKLEPNTVFQTSIRPECFEKLSNQFFAVIDTTYSASFMHFDDSVYEATLIAEFDLSSTSLQLGALTLIDGPFWSIFPTGKTDIYSVSHVEHGPLMQSTSEDEVNRFIDECDHTTIMSSLKRMADDILIHVPALEDSLASLRPRFIVKKIKTTLSSSSREVKLAQDGNRLFVRQGKVDAIFSAESLVLRALSDLEKP